MSVALRREAAHVFQQLLPVARDDADHDETAAHLAAVLMAPVEDVTEWAGDQDDGRTGWAPVMDLNTCPDSLLPWLGQFRGVVIRPGTDPTEARRLIGEAHGFQRGTRTGLISDVKTTLTGDQIVRVIERPSGQAHTVTVITLPSETPDSDVTLAAARDRRRKPLGILIELELSDAPLIDEGTSTIDAATGTIDTATLADVT